MDSLFVLSETLGRSNPDFGSIRALSIDNEPWFVGKDVAQVLGYERPTKAVQDRVDPEDKDEVPVQDSIGRMQNTPIINESGLYSLILFSKLPSAKKFKRWVTSIWNLHRPNEREIMRLYAETFGTNGLFGKCPFYGREATKNQQHTTGMKESILEMKLLIPPRKFRPESKIPRLFLLWKEQRVHIYFLTHTSVYQPINGGINYELNSKMPTLPCRIGYPCNGILPEG